MTDNLKHKIIKYLNSEFRYLEQFEPEVYPGYTFFMKDGEVVFDYNKKNKVVHISYKKIWSLLKNFFGLKDEEIQGVIKQWVEEHYKLRVITTISVSFWCASEVEEHYKLRVITTDIEDMVPMLMWKSIAN